MADTREISNRHKGIGDAQLAVLRACQQGRATATDLHLTLKAYASGLTATSIIQRLHRGGLIAKHRLGHYYVTARGQRELPSSHPAVAAMRPYVPPVAPPRRDGALDFRTLPSVAAGKEQPWKHPI